MTRLARARELIGVAVAGLTARKVRTLLIMLGPILGVSAIIAAIGFSESSKGNLKSKLAELGTDLIVVTAQNSIGGVGDDPKLPLEAVERVDRLDTVAHVSAVIELPGIVTLPFEGSREFYQAFPVPVIAADERLPAAVDVEVVSGRWLNQFDDANGVRSAVIGVDLAAEYAYQSNEVRTINLDGLDYAVVGVLAQVELVPSLNTTVFIPPSTAVADWGVEDEAPSRLYVRSPGATELTADVLPTVINLGGPEDVGVEVPSDLLETESQVDSTLTVLTIAMGVIALTVGGVGIANVMSISVIQRSGEIGIRRALGHSRAMIAGQFLLEAIAVGVLGGVVGAFVGVGVVWILAILNGFVVVLNQQVIVLATVAAILVSILFGLYPAMKAARLEPLETLRLG